MAKAAGIPRVVSEMGDGWHKAVGNGMVVPNVGMVLLATFASISPRQKFQASKNYIDTKIYKYLIIFSRNATKTSNQPNLFVF